MFQTLERHVAPPAVRPRRVFNFAWHFLEMCAAMCIAWMLVTMPFIAVAGAVGTADPVRDWPEVTTTLAVVAMSAGMAAQMRWRGHPRRCTAEMTAAMVVAAVVVFALAAAGAVPRTEEFALFHGLMPVAMIAGMLLRPELYTSPVNAHRRALRGTRPR